MPDLTGMTSYIQASRYLAETLLSKLLVEKFGTRQCRYLVGAFRVSVQYRWLSLS
jgi:hypothetical protein